MRANRFSHVSPRLPDPRQPLFTRMAAEEIRNVIQASRGRAFVLFTSYQQMRQVYDLVAPEIDFPTLLQGTAPRSFFSNVFGSRKPCPFATSSFWQGVDVQGEQLSCVVIDRLPFAVPAIPTVARRASAACGRPAEIHFTITRLPASRL